MLNFPVLKPDEFVYSAVARAGIYAGIVSHKRLLDVVYGDRKVVATMDLPSQLSSIDRHLKRTGRFSLHTLIYRHTLLPLYGPFVDEEKRQKAMKLMASKSLGAVHMMLGVSASRVLSPTHFRYCENCYKEQVMQGGEGYWVRHWYIPGLAVCAKHGKPLTEFGEGPYTHRHHYQFLYPPTMTVVEELTEKGSTPDWLTLDLELANKASALLDMEEVRSPNKIQWTRFYFRLAKEHGLTRGTQVEHGLIYEQLTGYYPSAYLESKGLMIDPEADSNWLKTLFRKHRKSFSYLQHLIVWQVFLPNLSVAEILDRVSSESAGQPTKNSMKSFSKEALSTDGTMSTELTEKRDYWSDLVQRYGVKKARVAGGGGAIYAWLYRHDNDWLMAFNRKNKKMANPDSFKQKVDWVHRDRQIVRSLFRILYHTDIQNVEGRMSARWFLGQVSQSKDLYKYLKKLPLTAAFLERYGETVTDYQLRRVAFYVAEQKANFNDYKPWKMMREAGLSEDRITKDTKQLLVQMGYYF